MQRSPVRCAGCLYVCVTLAASALLAQQAPVQQPTFRSETNLITVEVRVVDQQHRPIAALTKDDFKILEDGKPQVISHFVPINLAPNTSASGPLVLAAGSRLSGAPSTRRVFLIFLGRGDSRSLDLQVPSKGIDGMLHLVRNLLPQDIVAVAAWNRATEFTTDRDRIVALLERFRTHQRSVERQLLDHFSGLRAIYGSRDMPAYLQEDIDRVFYGEEAMPTRTILPPAPGLTTVVERGARRELDLLLGTPSFDVFRRAEAAQMGTSLDDYVVNRTASMQDLNRIYAMLDYLRYVDGEKHLVYVTPSGLRLPSADDDKSLARVAQDARVVIDIFHTAGTYTGMWDIASSQNIAEYSGGQFTGTHYGVKFADWINASSRTAYQLGYYSPNPALDGKYRKIKVEVNRPKAEALYRHGYYARETPAMLDRADIIARSRVEAALRYPHEVNDLRVSATAVSGRSADGARQMNVQITVDPAGVEFSRLLGDSVTTLDVGLFCVDEKRLLVGQLWKTVDLRLDEKAYGQFRRQGLGITVIVPIRRSGREVKIAVYDHTADRVGTVMIRPK